MRIGMFCDMYRPWTSGVTTHVSLCKRRFESLGHEVFVFTFGDIGYVDDEPNVVRSPGIRVGGTGWHFAPSHGPRAMRLAATLDVAHVHHPLQSGPIALRFARRHGYPIVFTNHSRYDLFADYYARLVPSAFRHAYVRSALRHVYRRADLVIAPSPSVLEWVRELGAGVPAELVPNGIDVAAFAHPAGPVPREDLGLRGDHTVLCAVGRLAPEKGTLLLIEAFALAAARVPSLRLLVVGDGPLRSRVERLLDERGVTDKVVLAGERPHARVPGLLAAADAFVTACAIEVHPLVVMEAMAAGLPVVGIDAAGVGETVEDGVSGLLAPAADAAAVAERMVQVADAAVRARLSEGASDASAAYGPERTADVVLESYERLVAR